MFHQALVFLPSRAIWAAAAAWLAASGIVPQIPGLPGVQSREHVFGVADGDGLAPGFQRLGCQLQPAGKLLDDVGCRFPAPGFQQGNVAGGVQVLAQLRLGQSPFQPLRAELLPKSVPHGITSYSGQSLYKMLDSLCGKHFTMYVNKD